MLKTTRIFFLFAVHVGSAAAQGAANEQFLKNLYGIARSALVQVVTSGTKAGGGTAFSEAGTGFYYETNVAQGRILTARHVVGRDSDFETRAGLPDRRATVNAYTEQFGARLYGPAKGFSTLAEDDKDVAIVYVDGIGTSTKFRLSKRVPQVNERVYIVSWPQSDSAIQPPFEAIVGAGAGNDGKLVRIARAAGTFAHSESGSPVIDARGAVVGVLVAKAATPFGQPTGWMLPVNEFLGLIPDAVVGPSPRELAECVDAELAKLRARKPFTVTESTHCDALKGGEKKTVSYQVPDGFMIVDQIVRNDRTQAGTATAIQYDRRGTEHVREVQATIECKQPESPFTPATFAATTLSGVVEKIVTAEEKIRIGLQCGGNAPP